MNNFMFQKLMTTKEQEENKIEEKQEENKPSFLENSGVEILEDDGEITPVKILNNDTNYENDKEEGYTARKNNWLFIGGKNGYLYQRTLSKKYLSK